MYGNAWSTCNDSRDPSRRLRLRKGGTITSRFQARSADFSPLPPQRAKAQYRSTNADKKAASCHDGLTTTLIWQGGYDDRNRQGNRRTRPTTYGRKGAGPETDHTMCRHQSHAEKNRARPCVSALAQMVHGLVRDWPGTVLLRLLLPDLPLAATVLPWRDSGPLHPVRSPQASGRGPAALADEQGCSVEGNPDDCGSLLPRHATDSRRWLCARGARHRRQRPGVRSARQWQGRGGLPASTGAGLVRGRHAYPVAMPDQTDTLCRNYHGPRSAALSAPRHAVAVGPGFSELRQRCPSAVPGRALAG